MATNMARRHSQRSAYLFLRNLDSDFAAKASIGGAIHFTHPAFAKLGGDVVVRYGFADHLGLIGTRRRSSSKKFTKKIRWFCPFCASGPSAGMSAAIALPSGEIL
jgi:hypothetical protein